MHFMVEFTMEWESKKEEIELQGVEGVGPRVAMIMRMEDHWVTIIYFSKGEMLDQNGVWSNLDMFNIILLRRQPKRINVKWNFLVENHQLDIMMMTIGCNRYKLRAILIMVPNFRFVVFKFPALPTLSLQPKTSFQSHARGVSNPLSLLKCLQLAQGSFQPLHF